MKTTQHDIQRLKDKIKSETGANHVEFGWDPHNDEGRGVFYTSGGHRNPVRSQIQNFLRSVGGQLETLEQTDTDNWEIEVYFPNYEELEESMTEKHPFRQIVENVLPLAEASSNSGYNWSKIQEIFTKFAAHKRAVNKITKDYNAFASRWEIEIGNAVRVITAGDGGVDSVKSGMSDEGLDISLMVRLAQAPSPAVKAELDTLLEKHSHVIDEAWWDDDTDLIFLLPSLGSIIN